MKILQLTNKVPLPPRDGGAIATLALARGLAEAGHEVTVLAMNTSKHFTPKEELEKLMAAEHFNLRAIPVDTSIRLLPMLANLLFSRLPYNGVRFVSRAYRHELAKLLRSQPFDVVLIENLYPILYLNLIRSCSSAAVVLRAHNLEHEIWERQASGDRGLRRCYTALLSKRILRLEKSVINRYDGLVTITNRDLLKFNELGNTKPAFVMPGGIDLKKASGVPPQKQRASLAYLGALDWLPNREGVLWFVKEVWPALRRSHPELTFHLAGRNAPVNFAEEIKGDGIIYHGEIADAGRFMTDHPIAVVPLFSGSGMRIKIIENMIRGRAVVTTRIGAEGIAAENGRDLLIADDTQAMIQCIEGLLNSPDKILQIGENAITFVRNNYDNRLLIGRLETFLSQFAAFVPNSFLGQRSGNLS